ncbi:FtsQ-type POTRA domain-containing protein [Amphibacillus sp. MSJ-3]|uniref:cell division protein FtsQ/DivIB n=1 Tax=Amphibacillus sp. MSJ-3 TaxID=2841505 RepID=UPI001C0F109D|nr:FtsQ-type POTRA domain-containing protein [Amphibacillus sp. MSJ-3]MBU5595400.1 FtsQ-type POTRA domain-containing protein [Amphibacillus sp. MSJ-3]
MDDEKVVSIEDRIPKLKEARRKKTNRRLIFYLCLFFCLLSIVVYLQSPLSYINEINVSGYRYTKPESIIESSQLSKEVNIWSFRTSEIENRLTEVPEIKEATVKRKFPNHVEINIVEFNKIAYLNKGDLYYPLLEDGHMLDSFHITEYEGDAPLLFDFSDDEYLMLFVEQLASLPSSVANHISEVYWQPTESNPYTLRLFMNDGFEVITSIRSFGDHMSSYPSIVSQLDDNHGIIEIGEGGAIYYKDGIEDHQKQDIDSEGGELDDESEG